MRTVRFHKDTNFNTRGRPQRRNREPNIFQLCWFALCNYIEDRIEVYRLHNEITIDYRFPSR
jgi:hypothetical protein